jgi:hypothetical protein
MYVFRGDEHLALHGFWRAHSECAAADSSALVCVGDGYTEQDWMDASSGYRQFAFYANQPGSLWPDDEFERWQTGWRIEDKTPVSTIP